MNNTNPSLWLKKAEVSLLMKKFKTAENTCEQVLKLELSNTKAKELLNQLKEIKREKFLNLIKQGDSFLCQTSYEKVLKYYTKALV